MNTLTKREITFCQNYVDNLGNGRQAAIDAGYGEAGAAVRACNLLKNMDVQLLIAKLEAERSESQRCDRERVILEMKRVALFDIRKLYNTNGRLKDVHEWDDESAAAIEHIETLMVNGTDDTVVQKVKAGGKLKALQELGKHYNIYEDHQKATGVINITIEGKDAQL